MVSITKIRILRSAAGSDVSTFILRTEIGGRNLFYEKIVRLGLATTPLNSKNVMIDAWHSVQFHFPFIVIELSLVSRSVRNNSVESFGPFRTFDAEMLISNERYSRFDILCMPST